MACPGCWPAPRDCTRTVLRVMEQGVGRIRTCDYGVYELGTGSDSPGGVGGSPALASGHFPNASPYY